MKALEILEVCGRSSLKGPLKRTGGNEAGVIALKSSGNDRVEAGDGRAEKSARGGTDDATGACACSARSEGSATCSCANLGSDAAYAAAGRVLHYAEVYT